MSMTDKTPDVVEPFKFLSTVDNKTYELPPFDAEKFADELADHADFIPKVSMTEALLADDPKAGMDMLQQPMQALNVLMTRGIVKTLRNHLEEDDPAWIALKELIDTYEFNVLAKIFTDWRKASGEDVSIPVGEA